MFSLRAQYARGILDLPLRKIKSGKSHDNRDEISVSKMSTRKRKACVFSPLLWFEERFRKVPFS